MHYVRCAIPFEYFNYKHLFGRNLNVNCDLGFFIFLQFGNQVESFVLITLRDTDTIIVVINCPKIASRFLHQHLLHLLLLTLKLVDYYAHKIALDLQSM